ncbi:MAG: leucine-rich repeat protein [Clostridia bacterium]|nr:leucine-rich repeat protein [Clostridia bacterium]
MKKPVFSLCKALGTLLSFALALALCLGWSAPARAAGNCYYLMVSVTDLSSDGWYDSCHNSLGYIMIATANGTTAWQANVVEKEWDHEDQTFWYVGGCEGTVGNSRPSSVDSNSAVYGFPTELRLVTAPSETSTSYMTNKNQTYTSKCKFTIWISTNKTDFTELCSWTEKTSAGGKWSDSKTVPSSVMPKLTKTGPVSGPSDIYIPKVGEASNEYQFSASALDQYSVYWGGSYSVNYSLSNAVDGISIDSSGKLTITQAACSLDTYKGGTFQITISAQLKNVSGCGTTTKKVNVHYPKYTVRYRSGTFGYQSEYEAEFGSRWVHTGETTYKQSISTVHYYFTGWDPDPNGYQVDGDVWFDPVFREEAHNFTTYSPDYARIYCSVCNCYESAPPSGFLSGGGTQANPWIIRNADDWNTLAAFTAAHGLTSGYYRLDGDITVSAMLGIQNYPFQGYLDGNGHTLTLDISDLSSDYVAPFRYMSGGGISRLKVSGSITGGYYCSALIGRLQTQETAISDCLIDASITSNYRTVSAFIHTAEASFSLTNCIFTGSIDTSSIGSLVCHSLYNNRVKCSLTNFLDWSDSREPVIITDASATNVTAAKNVYYRSDKRYTGSSVVWGKKALTVSAANEDIQLSFDTAGSASYWGLTPCEDGLIWGGAYCAGEGDSVNVTITPSPLPEGILFSLNSGSMTALESGRYALTMGAEPMVIRLILNLSGSGTAGSPWLIPSGMHWDVLASEAALGMETEGKHFLLTSSISINRMLGTEEHPFRGSFDGGGYTLTFNAESNDDDIRHAPFAYTSGAVIKNLRTAGSIVKNASGCAGLIGENGDRTTVENCRVSMSLTGWCYVGGFCIGEGSGGLTLIGCVFDGSISVNQMSGGFVGYSAGSLTIRDCLFAPSAASENNYHGGGTFYYNSNDSNTAVIENSCYLRTLGAVQGSRGYTVVPGEYVTVGFGEGAQTYSVSGLTAYTAGLGYGNAFYAGEGFNVSLILSQSFMPGYGKIGYTASAGTLTAAVDGWQLLMPASNVTINCALSLSGSGTGEAPYEIDDAADWNALVYCIPRGYDTSGRHFALKSDITVTQMIGTSSRPFSGTFDGLGHTLTFSGSNTSDDDRVAPFAYVSGAAFKNLRTAGAITGTADRCSGLIGENRDRTTVENCRVSMSLSGKDFVSGFCIGTGSGGLSFTGCLFDGEISASVKGCCFVGWTTNRYLIFRNCLSAPAASSDGNPNVYSFYYNSYTPDRTGLYNSYYVTPCGFPQGHQAFTVTSDADTVMDFGEGTVYSTSGITAWNVGLSCGGVFLAADGDTISLSLSLADGVGTPAECVFAGYLSSAGLLKRSGEGWSLSMPAEDVFIHALFAPVFGTPDFTLPAGLAAIEAEAFEDAAMTVLAVPQNCVSIGDRAFRHCRFLTQIRIPADCVLGEDVFDECELVFVYGVPGSPAESYCEAHGNCVFVGDADE